MLTLDDLDHFSEPTMASLFAAPAQQLDVNAAMRRERILACLGFCRDVPNDELAERALQAARRQLRTILRNARRNGALDPFELSQAIEAVLHGLGEAITCPDEPSGAATLRHAVEAEIQLAARNYAPADTSFPQLLDILVQGEFEIGASSNIVPLGEAIRAFNATGEIDIHLATDADTVQTPVRVHLALRCGVWRWSAEEGCSIISGDQLPISVAPNDALVQTIMAGLALRGGRTICAWADAIEEHQERSQTAEAV